MDIGELTYAGRQVGTDASGEDRRYRFRLGGQVIDAVLPAASAQVWRQAHPEASDDELDEWAAAEGERCVRARLEESPLDVGRDDPARRRRRRARGPAEVRRGRAPAPLVPRHGVGAPPGR